MPDDAPPTSPPDSESVHPNEATSPSEDVNRAVVEDWKAETTPFERVYQTLRRTRDPQSADEIADRARVSPTTVRKHLRTLADVGEVVTEQDGRTTLYRRSKVAVVTEHAHRLLAEHSIDEVAAGVADMKASIREWREEHGVESPEEFAREMDVEDADEESGVVVREWQTTRRNLALAEATLAIGQAVDDGRLLEATGDGDETSLLV